VSISARLVRKLQEALGDEAAEDLLTLIQGFGEQRESIRGDFAEFRQEMHAGFETVRGEIQGLNAKIEQRSADLIKWSFVFWVSAVGAIAALAGMLDKR